MSPRRLFAILAVVVLHNNRAGAAVIRVPEDQPGLLQAVDSAASGDSIIVGPGTWTDQDTRFVSIGSSPPTWVTSCAFLRGNLTIIGEQGAEATIIEGDGGPVQILFWSNDLGKTMNIEGLTITGAGGLGIQAVRCGTLTLRSCRISNNVGLAVSSRALYFDEVDLHMFDSEVSYNSAPNEVPGINGLRFDICEIRHCRFESNVGRAVSVGEAFATIVVTDCEFVENRSDGSREGGGGLDVFSGSGFTPTATILIERNLFLRNVTTGGTGGGMRVGPAIGSIRFNTFAFDSATGLSVGGGLAMVRYAGEVSNNTFYRCHGDHFAAAIEASDIFSGLVSHNVFSFSTGGEAVAGGFGSTFVGGCNLFFGNEEGDFYGTWGPLPNDVFADPLFCDAENLDLSVSSESPCVSGNTPGCGGIGAWGIGCGDISVEDTSWGKIKALYR